MVEILFGIDTESPCVAGTGIKLSGPGQLSTQLSDHPPMAGGTAVPPPATPPGVAKGFALRLLRTLPCRVIRPAVWHPRQAAPSVLDIQGALVPKAWDVAPFGAARVAISAMDVPQRHQAVLLPTGGGRLGGFPRGGITSLHCGQGFAGGVLLGLLLGRTAALGLRLPPDVEAHAENAHVRRAFLG